MKRILLAIALPVVALAQAPPDKPQPPPLPPAAAPLPEAPAPAPAGPPSMWNRIEHLPRGEAIKISYGRGSWERCRFAGATDEAVFCEPREDSGPVQEYRIDRFSIADFKMDHDERNGRLIFTAITLGSGLALGIRAAQTSQTDPQAMGVIGGLLGTGLGALVAVPFSCLSGHCVALHLPPPQPMPYGIGYNVPIGRLTRSRR